METAKHYVVHGLVQGVGYRFFALNSAETIGVAGWVRNLPDGTVEAFAEGAPERLEAFAAQLRRGPRYSVVERLDEEDAEPAGNVGFRQVR